MGLSRSVLRARRKKALNCAHAGRLDEALKLLLAVCSAEPCDAEALCLLGAVSGQLGQYDRALEHCRKATFLRPDYVEAWYNLAQACMHLEYIGEAVNAYRMVVVLASDYADAHFNLGYALEQAGDYEGAARSYRTELPQGDRHPAEPCGSLLQHGQPAEQSGARPP